jgi:hypothetical protein
VVDSHQDEKSKKKKKKHRGYAFVVFEREKDMGGKPATHPFMHIALLPWILIWPFCLKMRPSSLPLFEDMALKLPSSFSFHFFLCSSTVLLKVYKMGNMTDTSALFALGNSCLRRM